MTGHNARRPRTGRERRLRWRLSRAFYLTVWTLNDRIVASLVNCMALSDYTGEGKLKIENVFCGVVSLDGRCSVQAELRKKPVAVGPLPGAYLPTETNFVPIRGVTTLTRKEFDTEHTRARTHTHVIKAPFTARFLALARTWPLARIMSALNEPPPPPPISSFFYQSNNSITKRFHTHIHTHMHNYYKQIQMGALPHKSPLLHWTRTNRPALLTQAFQDFHLWKKKEKKTWKSLVIWPMIFTHYTTSHTIESARNTAWCSEIGSLTSRDACNSGASSDRRGPISLHQAVQTLVHAWLCTRGYCMLTLHSRAN